MHDIFLSYSRKDSDTMQKVKQTFRDAGFTLWTDEGIEPGTHDWRMAIENAIRDSQCLVCICSPDAKQSRWVQSEIHRAEKRQKHIFLILLRGNELDSIPFGYDFHQFTDIRSGNDYETAMSKLIGSMQTRIKPSASPDEQETVEFKIPDFSVLDDEPEELQAALKHIKSLMPNPFDWCYIPAGDVMLEAGGYVPEGGKTYHVDAFYMAKYPVTNRQYAEFIGAGGYRTREYWTEEGWQLCKKNKWTQPRFFHNTKWNRPLHPVVGVSWYEALAFTSWLDTQWTDEAYVIGKISLPTEQQWQRAAQGDDGRRYPWGERFYKGLTNTKESAVNKTTPVTQYPKGNSLFDVADMSGNVWEWCLTSWNTGTNDSHANHFRLLHGGSWLGDADNALNTTRFGWDSDYRDNIGGFRICANLTQLNA